MIATCVNPACDENGIPKPAMPGEVYPPDIVVRCGACGEECEVTAAPARE
jgi:hypothetical protein